MKPLLDALADADVSQQRIAIDVLGYVQNKNAALPLFAFATGPAEAPLRSRAMLACGALADGALVPKLEALLFPKEAGGDVAGLADAVGVAAVWGLARMKDPKALPVLRRVARGGTPPMRALAVLGLGAAHDPASVADVTRIASSVDSGNVARAAAAYALGELGATAQVPALLELAEESDALPRSMALVALSRMAAAAGREPAWQHEAVQVMADAVFAGDDDRAREGGSNDGVVRAALAGLASLADVGDRAHPPAQAREVLPVPEGSLDVDVLLDALVPREVSDAGRAAAITKFAEPLQRAALAALRTSGGRARAVLDALGTGSGELLPFVPRGATGPAADAARAISKALEPSLIPLARHPDPDIRARALVLVAHAPSDEAAQAVVGGLEDGNEAVQRVALAAVATPRADGSAVPASARAVAAVGKLLATHESWAMRVLAAQAMGRLGHAGAGPDAVARLTDAATKDSYALVRQAALEALATFDASAARTLAARVAAGDPEPRVRDAARAIAAGQSPASE